MAAPRVVVFAYGGFGCAGIEAVRAAGGSIVHGFSHADDPRETRWWPSVAERLAGLGVPCELDRDLRAVGAGSAAELLGALAPDLLLSFYFRSMIPERLLGLARRGGYNLHGSLLPRFRGRAPINWQLVHGERESGLTLHRMVRSADAGDIVGQLRVTVPEDQDALGLTRALLELAPGFLAGLLPALFAGTAVHRPQDPAQATVFGGRRPEDGRIDWRWPARQVHNLVRAVAPPWPGAFSTLAGERVAIDRARVAAEDGRLGPPGTVLPGGHVACGAGSLEVLLARDARGGNLLVAPGTRLDLPPAPAAPASPTQPPRSTAT
jgi:UDP-4-amino-4-deoxy-L-arabinose formyltransferase/UDP-glucuronic acid dehydrogenase (UDP-4-keto-hexauronic acid decarboxylating)